MTASLPCPTVAFRCPGCGAILAELHGRRFIAIGPALIGERVRFSCRYCGRRTRWVPTGDGAAPGPADCLSENSELREHRA